MSNIFFLIAPLAAISLTACSTLGGGVETAPERQETAVLVPNSRLPLFADISPFKLSQAATMTKGDGEESVPLESLLNRDKSATDPFKEFTFTEVPFHDDGTLVRLCSQRNGSDSNFTKIKKFLIKRASHSETIMYVATMLPDTDYANEHPGFTFIDSPDFTGLAIFSDLEGHVLDVRQYSNGRIMEAMFLNKDNIDNHTEGLTYIYILNASDAKTKSDDEPDELEPSYCTAGREGRDNHNNGHDDEDHDEGQTPFDGGDGMLDEGGGSSNNPPNNENYDEEFTVTLSCNAPEAIFMKGDGKYKKNASVLVSCVNKKPFPLQFKYWAGDFSGIETSTVSFKIERDMVSHAFFVWGEKPCMKQDHTGNPLINMSVASSGKGWNNWKGGAYGKYRAGNTQMHSGLDLEAPVGTSVFSMYDGVVVSTFTTAIGGENGAEDNIKLGNDIRIKTTLPNGQTIIAVYAHLQQGTPIAINSRTNEPFKEGDRVFAGEMIAYSGKTGNAYNVDHPHVHLGIKIGRNWIDPQPYINGTYNIKELNNNQGKIVVTDCY